MFDSARPTYVEISRSVDRQRSSMITFQGLPCPQNIRWSSKNRLRLQTWLVRSVINKDVSARTGPAACDCGRRGVTDNTLCRNSCTLSCVYIRTKMYVTYFCSLNKWALHNASWTQFLVPGEDHDPYLPLLFSRADWNCDTAMKVLEALLLLEEQELVICRSTRVGNELRSLAKTHHSDGM